MSDDGPLALAHTHSALSHTSRPPALPPHPSRAPHSDCWEEKNPPRDPATGELRADTKRFPSGMKALGDYVHSKGLSFAIYSAESTETCGGYPASLGKEALDAA